MSKCPKCKSDLPFFKVGFLSNALNGIVCPSCDAYSKAERSQLSTIGASGAVIGVFLLNWVYAMFKNHFQYWYLGILVVILFFIGILFLQNKTLTFKIAEKPIEKDANVTKKDSFNGKIPDKISEPIEHLKYIYRDYPEAKLEEIANGNGYRNDAIMAASQLLKEKFNG